MEGEAAKGTLMPGKALRTALVRSVVRTCQMRQWAFRAGRDGATHGQGRHGADYTRAENAERAAKWLG